jgi:hypothetical protein
VSENREGLGAVQTVSDFGIHAQMRQCSRGPCIPRARPASARPAMGTFARTEPLRPGGELPRPRPALTRRSLPTSASPSALTVVGSFPAASRARSTFETQLRCRPRQSGRRKHTISRSKRNSKLSGIVPRRKCKPGGDSRPQPTAWCGSGIRLLLQTGATRVWIRTFREGKSRRSRTGAGSPTMSHGI